MVTEALKHLWAWGVTIWLAGWSYLADLGGVTILSILVALATLHERYRLARKHRAEEELALAQIDEISEHD